MTRCFVFPGQGSQYVGMGKALFDSFADARDVFEKIDEALSQKLSRLMFEGPESDLNLTENTQPALMAVSLAIAKILEKQGNIDWNKICHFMAGHSLGEYSALTTAGALKIAECATLLKLRGQAMQKAVPIGKGAMAAILGMNFADVQKVAQESSGQEICAAANDNSDGQVVISGHTNAVEAAVALASQRGAKKAIMLPVSAPFHCILMQPAADAMAEALSGITIKPPIVPIISNVTAQAEQDPSRIKTLLVEQVTGMVRWRESVLWMKNQGVREIFELGAGKVLCGLIKRIDKDIACENIETPQAIEMVIKKLS